jgi:RNA polymerase sigma-70 factor, ECF subfamily
MRGRPWDIGPARNWRRGRRPTPLAASRGDLVRAALTKLSPEHREILDLVYYHENSVEDCALILNIPVATVKTRKFYARKKLAALVQEA